LVGGVTVSAASKFYIPAWEPPMCIAAKNGHTEVVIFLMDRLLAEVEHPCQEFEPDNHIYSVLSMAAGWGRADIVQYVLEVGQRTDGCWLASHEAVRSKKEYSNALCYAARSARASVVNLLVLAGMNASQALKRAEQSGNVSILRQLLAAVTSQDADRALHHSGALLYAMFDKNVDMVRELLAAGADPTLDRPLDAGEECEPFSAWDVACHMETGCLRRTAAGTEIFNMADEVACAMATAGQQAGGERGALCVKFLEHRRQLMQSLGR
jgi:hypothetical protein